MQAYPIETIEDLALAVVACKVRMASKVYPCEICGASLATKWSLRRHRQSLHAAPTSSINSYSRPEGQYLKAVSNVSMPVNLDFSQLTSSPTHLFGQPQSGDTNSAPSERQEVSAGQSLVLPITSPVSPVMGDALANVANGDGGTGVNGHGLQQQVSTNVQAISQVYSPALASLQDIQGAVTQIRKAQVKVAKDQTQDLKTYLARQEEQIEELCELVDVTKSELSNLVGQSTLMICKAIRDLAQSCEESKNVLTAKARTRQSLHSFVYKIHALNGHEGPITNCTTCNDLQQSIAGQCNL